MPTTPRRRDGGGTGNTLRRIDDASPEIEYSGQWTAGTANTSSSDQATVHTSTQSGSTIKFSFTGTFVAVYGILDGDPYAASFTIDGGAPSTASLSEPPASPKPDWPFFSRLLDPGAHALEVTLNSGTFNLDYIDYTSDGTPGEHGDDPSSSSGATPSEAASSASASASALPRAKTGLSTGAVAGIAVAGVVILALLVLMLYCVLVRRTRARRVRHRSVSPEKPLELIPDGQPKTPPRRHFRLPGSIYRPTPARSAQSSKTATSSSSAPTSVTQSSAMFTSVIMLSPALSMVSEESDSAARQLQQV
ncbi:hypothetical protein L226DRAFT_526519 [Lentinus tigrinus ALCF2SS1-7]|uniref:Uncharacterized protein n=1 Tax=Lentinus tigrinus ALCF2SS1-6 TaxID=1328759 RepID=A0A5C2SAP7_9APHY|nr:hypothetical protein L227DRAFT_95082 [Lentinus tigrinus ALCF2SS1-6]RPD69492.1 hypothetical protein L226DRAFT_526519 [Lentinus tigrinus ALCF2SS1-7]